VRRSFFVCFWYDFRAAWKIAWKRDSEEAAVVAGVGDMTRACDCGRIYESYVADVSTGQRAHGQDSQSVGERQ
jgi:hypothetical protein